MNNRQFKFFAFFLVVGGYAWLALNWNFLGEEKHSLCIVKYVTGYPCPACGTTRAVILLTKGNVVKAIQTNPLGLIAAGFLLLAPFWLCYDFFKRKEATWLTYRWAETKIQSNLIISISLVVLVAINWVWNIYKGV